MAAMKTFILLLFVFEIRTEEVIELLQFPIAGLFNERSLDRARSVFETIAVSGGSLAKRNYHGRIIHPSVTDSYSTSLEVCQSASSEKPIVALIDARPTDGYCDNTCLICNKLNIVHLSLGWEPTETMAKDLYTFAYAPPPYEVSKAFTTLIKHIGWDRFTIFYEDDSSFIRLQEVIDTWSIAKDPITFRKLVPGEDNRETFKDILKVERLSHHILDCDIANIRDYFKQIIDVDNSTQYQTFILTNLDAITMNLQELPTEPGFIANVSTLSMMIGDSSKWKDINYDPEDGVKLEMALAVDALNHLVRALKKLQNETSTSGSGFQPIPPLCFQTSKEDYAPWEWGERLREQLISTQEDGFTGHIEFDEFGQRQNFILHHSRLNFDSDTKQYSFNDAGFWDSQTEDFIITDTEEVSTPPKTKIIRVVSRQGRPYFDIDPETKEMRGYAVDLVDAIVKIMNDTLATDFKHEFHEVKDGAYGSPIQGTKKWNGIIGELMAHEADLGICDLSITADRNKAVDFSTPFMTTGISMLFREKDPVDPDMFSFINPLSLDVWLYLATAYILVSVVLFLCARMSRDDWVNPHPCNQNPDNLQNIWSLYNCMWLTMGTIMTQGCDILPRGLGSRWIAGIWYFFAMIVTASYTANMSTFISSSRRSNDITDARQLAKQTQISYGAVYNASTYYFFKNSNDTAYSKLWQVMESTKPTVFMTSNEEGKNRVLKSKGMYAFFMESTAIKYYTERDPMLKMVGSPLDSKSYGIAMPKDYQYKWLVDSAILTLQEHGNLTLLYNKWWKEEWNYIKTNTKAAEEDDSGSLQMKNTGGIFMVLGLGGILGLIVAIIDFMLHAQTIAVKEKVTFKEALASEWRASMNPRGLSKPAAPPRSAPPSTSSSPPRERSRSRAISVLHAASSFINFDEIY